MDSRIALKNGYILRLEGKEAPVTFTICKELGRGASCIVYDASYETMPGDIKHVRIKECCPFRLKLSRDSAGALAADAGSAEAFEKEKSEMARSFSAANTLFYSEGLYDSLVNTTDLYAGNNTVYIVSSYSGSRNLAQYEPHSLKECVALIKNVAYVIRKIHAQGYLYLDSKPENVLVAEGMVSRILLFDFDSLLPIPSPSGADNSSFGRISFTKGFAALELQQGRLNSLGPHTDVFGVGALLFYLIFGRAPGAFDSLSDAVYPFEAGRFADASYRDGLFPALTAFFHKTLVSHYPDRYGTMDEVITVLDELLDLADVTATYLVSVTVIPPVCFFGREKELGMINEWWSSADPVLYITGMGGIGKSTIVKQFISTLEGTPDAVVFLTYSGNLLSTIIDDSALSLNTVERRQEETDENYYSRKIRLLRKYLAGRRVLAVIDNFTRGDDIRLSEIKKLGWKLILITRETPPSDAWYIRLEAIEDVSLLRSLFERNLGRSLSADELPYFRRISAEVGGNTLAVQLLAKQIAASAITVSAASELLSRRGISEVADEEVSLSRDDIEVFGTVKKLLEDIFALDELSEKEQAVLKLLFLLSPDGIPAGEFRYLSEIEDLNTVNRLAGLGWINSEQQVLSMHPVIAELVEDLPFSEAAEKYAVTAAKRLFIELALEGRKEDYPREFLEIMRKNTDNPVLEWINRKNLIDPALSEIIRRRRDQIDNVNTTDHVRLRRLVGIAGSLLRGCEADRTLMTSDRLVDLRMITIENTSSEYNDLKLKEIDTLIGICSEGAIRIRTRSYMKLLDMKMDILADYDTLDPALEVLKEAGKIARRSPGPRIRALYHAMAYTYFEVKASVSCEEEDRESCLRHADLSVKYTKAARNYGRKKTDLCERLLSKVILYIRQKPEADIDDVLAEAEDLAMNHLQPYSECRYGLYMAKAWYCVEKNGDLKGAMKNVIPAVSIAERTSETPLDYIDRIIIPVARMSLDAGRCDLAELWLNKGVALCDDNLELEPYIDKRRDLLDYMEDVHAFAEENADR